jgi:hypothetical protein
MFKCPGMTDLTSTAWNTVYTCPSGKTAIISKIILTNNASTSCNFLMLVGSAVDGQYYAHGAWNVMPYGGYKDIPGGYILNAGESIYIHPYGASTTAIIHGDEITANTELKRLGGGWIAQNAWSNIYTCPSGKTTYISKMTFQNGWGACGNIDCTVKIAHVLSGQSASDKYIVRRELVLKEGHGFDVSGGVVMNAGDTIQVYTTGTYGISAVWGNEIATSTGKMLGAIDITAGAWTNIYTVPSGKQTVVSKAILTNNNTSYDSYLYMAHIPSGQSITSAKYYMISQRIGRYDGGYIELGGITLATDDVLSAYASASSCNAIAWGDETNV